MIHQRYTKCHYCGKPIPADDNSVAGDTVFCSQICFIRRIVQDMFNALHNKEVKDKSANKKHYGFRFPKKGDKDG
jgi:hypothetical protein